MKPYYEDDLVKLYHGDCIDVLRELPDASVDSIVTDPPYGLGFMGREWDNLPPGLPWAQECLRVLKPGGHLLAFGGTRTWHRLACAVEDAGFEVRDSIAWMYGSGFPKSLDVSKAIDKLRVEDREPMLRVRAWLNAQRVERGVSLGQINALFGLATNGGGNASNWTQHPTNIEIPSWEKWLTLKDALDLSDEMDAEVWRLNGRKGKPGDNFESREVLSEVVREVKGGSWADNAATGRYSIGEKVIRDTAPATPDAERWQGWGTALKPAHEPVVCARKPLSGTVASNVLAHGTGALNIDGCRIEATDKATFPVGIVSETEGVYGNGDGRYADRPRTADPNPSGRWPANVILDESQAEALDEQSGETVSNVRTPSGKDDRGAPNTASQMVMRRNDTDPRGVADSGGASRFFPVFKEDDSCTDTTTPAASAPTLTATGAPDATHAPDTTTPSGASSAGDSGATTDLPIELMVERFRYVAKADTSERVRVDGIAHPTVKPLALMRWLVRLVTPPGGTVLEPFAGSGTTVEACLLEGFQCIAIEREDDYLPLIVQRIQRRRDPVAAVKAAGDDAGLFDLLDGEAS